MSSLYRLAVLDLGLLDYENAYVKQKELVDRLKKSVDEADYLILVEHPEVYTYGRRSRDEMDSSLSHVVSVERGGEATFHNPGQLVCYPILRLRDEERDVHQFLRRLESTIIDVLQDYGLRGERKRLATGVWVDGATKKIASIGVAFSSWISFHGIALNVSNDLSGFYRINPCGFSADVMTSMREILGSTCPNVDDVKRAFIQRFCERFGRTRC